MTHTQTIAKTAVILVKQSALKFGIINSQMHFGDFKNINQILLIWVVLSGLDATKSFDIYLIVVFSSSAKILIRTFLLHVSSTFYSYLEHLSRTSRKKM